MKRSTMLTVGLLASTVFLVTGCKELGGGKGGGSDSQRIEVPFDGTSALFCSDDSQLFGLEWAQVYPEDGNSNVATGSYIMARFTHEPDAQSFKNASFGLKTTADPAQEVGLTVSINGKDASFKPEGDHLLPNTDYKFYMEAGGENGIAAAVCEGDINGSKYLVFLDGDGSLLVDGGEPVTEQENTFTTGDGNFLKVVSTVPSNDDFGVGVNVNPKVIFNQPVKFDADDCPLSLAELDNDKITIVSAIDGSCETDGDNAILLSLDNPLEVDKYYKLTVDNSKVDAVDDTADPMANEDSIIFRTNGIGPRNLTNCASQVSGLCVLGGEGHDEGLADLLLDQNNGPIAPLASQIGGVDELAGVLETLLENDDGELLTLVENLIVEGNLAEGLEQLLISEKGLRSILPDLLAGDGEGDGGLEGLLASDEGVKGLLEALLIPGDEGEPDASCVSYVGTVCMVAADGSERKGLLELLVASDSELGKQGISADELVETLGKILGEEQDLGSTVAGLFADGRLAEGLQALLIGDDENAPVLITTLESVVGGLVGGLGNIIGGLLGLGR